MLKNLYSASQQSLITSKGRILALQALGIGLAAGLLAVGFRLSLESAEAARSALIAFATSRGGAYLALPSLVFGLLIAGVVYVTVCHAPDASGSGIPHLKGYLSGDTTFRGWRILAAKFLGGLVGIGSGLALGREGPTVQMGAAVAKILAKKPAPSSIHSKTERG